ncbi:MAG: nucleotide-diphospho-sugar transferase [Verrucomicrobiota bacterium]
MSESYQCKSPVLFLVFNRPEQTAEVFQSIRNAKPSRLYVAADGPRDGRVGEAERCCRVREIALSVDWNCEVKTLFRGKNLGCGKAVSEGISWFFENEEMGIVLEDDVLVLPRWLAFADELLVRYKDDYRIGSISAQSPNLESRVDQSYWFSSAFLCWGWASWRRVWRDFDFEIADEGKGIRDFTSLHRFYYPFEVRWNRVVERLRNNQVDTWDYRVQLCFFKNKYLSIVPSANAVTNIGFGEDATHTTGSPESLNAATFQFTTLEHPSTVLLRKGLDRRLYKEIQKLSWSHALRSLTAKWIRSFGVKLTR